MKALLIRRIDRRAGHTGASDLLRINDLWDRLEPYGRTVEVADDLMLLSACDFRRPECAP